MIKPRLQFGHTNKLRAGFNAYLEEACASSSQYESACHKCVTTYLAETKVLLISDIDK